MREVFILSIMKGSETKELIASRTTGHPRLKSTIKPPRNISGVILARKDLHWSIFHIAFEAILVKIEEL